MGINFTFFSAKRKALESKPEPFTGSKRLFDESDLATDEDVPSAKRRRTSEEALDNDDSSCLKIRECSDEEDKTSEGGRKCISALLQTLQDRLD